MWSEPKAAHGANQPEELYDVIEMCWVNSQTFSLQLELHTDAGKSLILLTKYMGLPLLFMLEVAFLVKASQEVLNVYGTQPLWIVHICESFSHFFCQIGKFHVPHIFHGNHYGQLSRWSFNLFVKVARLVKFILKDLKTAIFHLLPNILCGYTMWLHRRILQDGGWGIGVGRSSSI